MSESTSSETQLHSIQGEGSNRAADAFAAIGNQTRLSILLALWDAWEPFEPDDSLSFSDLWERVEIQDSGQFNYHLQQLCGYFIEESGAGYRLRNAGKKLVQTVIAGVGIENPEIEPTQIDFDCYLCGSSMAITYQENWLYLVCSNCEGNYGIRDTQPDGMLAGAYFNPTGISNRTPEAMWNAVGIAMFRDLRSGVEGVCEICSGPMDSWLDVCEDHQTEGICSKCGREEAVMARSRCNICKNNHRASPKILVSQHPAVVSFYYERGVSLQWEIADVSSGLGAGQLITQHDQQILSTQPPEVLVTIQYAGDTLELTLNGALEVVDVRQSK